jgi:hypothetical protein
METPFAVGRPSQIQSSIEVEKRLMAFLASNLSQSFVGADTAVKDACDTLDCPEPSFAPAAREP